MCIRALCALAFCAPVNSDVRWHDAYHHALGNPRFACWSQPPLCSRPNPRGPLVASGLRSGCCAGGRTRRMGRGACACIGPPFSSGYFVDRMRSRFAAAAQYCSASLDCSDSAADPAVRVRVPCLCPMGRRLVRTIRWSSYGRGLGFSRASSPAEDPGVLLAK
jgi:hypothetical protein